MATRDVVASPSVVALAGRLGVDLAALAGSTGRTTIAREDVERYASRQDNASANASAVATTDSGDRRYWDVDHSAFGPVTQEPLSGHARAASDNLSAAHRLIPQVTHHDRADMRAIDALRARWKARAAARGVRLTALAFHVKALSICLATYPRFNASLTPDGTTLTLKRSCHVGIAVDTPHGLMVPVVRDVDHKGLLEIAEDIGNLAARAQERKLKTNEMSGASMSVSNLGGIGGTAFTPIVNPPEVAILGITRTEKVPVWEDGSWEPVPMVPLDLSYDHRVVNGADAARFVTSLCDLLANPRRMMI